MLCQGEVVSEKSFPVISVLFSNIPGSCLHTCKAGLSKNWKLLWRELVISKYIANNTITWYMPIILALGACLCSTVKIYNIFLPRYVSGVCYWVKVSLIHSVLLTCAIPIRVRWATNRKTGYCFSFLFYFSPFLSINNSGPDVGQADSVLNKWWWKSNRIRSELLSKTGITQLIFMWYPQGLQCNVSTLNSGYIEQHRDWNAVRYKG